MVAALPSLAHDQRLLRQWTCRVISETATVCFLSTFPGIGLPEITPDDIIKEKAPKTGDPLSCFTTLCPQQIDECKQDVVEKPKPADLELCDLWDFFAEPNSDDFR
jgi:hypothetical protein